MADVKEKESSTPKNEVKKGKISQAQDIKYCNIVNVFNRLQTGQCKSSILNRAAEQAYLQNVMSFRSTFQYKAEDYTIKEVAWHPTNPYLLATRGKRLGGGRLILLKVRNSGTGPGKLHKTNMSAAAFLFNTNPIALELYIAGYDGKLARCSFNPDHHFNLIKKIPLFSCEEEWFSTLGIHPDGKTLYAGHYKGDFFIYRLDCGKIERYRSVHFSTIEHLELNTSDPNLLVTSSRDRRIKLWDLRQFGGKNNFLVSFKIPDISPPAAAKFSRTDGCRLLIAEKDPRLTIYKAPLWTLENEIVDHRRPCITHISTCWHPSADMFLASYSPQLTLKSENYVKVYSTSSGLLCKELCRSKNTLRVAEFNSTGTHLATSGTQSIQVWKIPHAHNIRL